MRRAFTLVEIMIVFVIIGLLAALAIPAFKKVRNQAMEKAMFNDARQLSAAVQIYASENALTAVPVRALASILPRLSSGTILVDRNSAGPWGTADGSLGSSVYQSMTLELDAHFGLINQVYDPRLSTHPLVPAASYGNGLRFSVATGQLAAW